ncbi:hypothetical protein BN2475_490073 [Paraburkholderia ribeironis]|uniref:Uncharacterized protein n=1 Tax=Paraburkholderia ribeironis TaxID=1247936 RepID=A0A1N7SBV3_9BURK|nr:hypothetical protein BN2475_490073 [Paraburkholderia ribeironis]
MVVRKARERVVVAQGPATLTRPASVRASPTRQSASPKAKTREAGGYAGFILHFVVGAKGFEPSTL